MITCQDGFKFAVTHPNGDGLTGAGVRWFRVSLSGACGGRWCVLALMGETAMTDGRTARGIYWRSRGNGPALVLLHGLFATGQMFDPLVERMKRSYQLVIPDIAGHGRSGNVSRPYHAPDLARDVMDVLDAVGVERASVLGYSQGGPTALQAAYDWPARVDSLILACTYAHNTATTREQIEGAILSCLEPSRVSCTLGVL